MTEKELKKLNRYQLLELLLVQTERADHLQEKVDELTEQLELRSLNLSKLGSIAEAAMQVSGVLEASQRAADLYFESAKKQADELIAQARRKASSIIVEAEARAYCMTEMQQKFFGTTVESQNTDDEKV